MNANYDQVLGKILEIVSRFPKDGSTPDEATALQTDIGMTSLQVMELVLEVEDEFDISFPLNRLPDIRTVKDLTREIAAVLDR